MAATNQPSPDEALALCRLSLIGYAIANWQGYRPARHHHLIANALQRVAKGECKRLMIFMPPRHGKSMLASEYFPGFYIGHHPEHQIIHATYAQELSDGFGRKVRNQLSGDVFKAVFPGVALASDSAAAARFHTEAGGVYHGVGIGGSATGRGANLLLIDDPVKGREEAESEVMRQKLKDWYSSVAYTRLMPGGAIVVIQTRWHEDDLAGWILNEHQHEGWEVIDLPARGIDGAALWPEAYPIERLNQIEATIGPRDWEALYQQRPRPIGGGEFKRDWLQFYTNPPHPGTTNNIILVDPASGKRENNDFTSMWVIGLGPDDNYYALDIVRDRLNLTERAETVFRLHRKWKPHDVRYERYGMMADIEFLRTEMDRRNYRFSVTEVGGQVKKEDRIRRLIPLFERKRVWLPREFIYTDTTGKTRDLVHEFIETEYLAFPVARHDDMMDGLSRISEPTLDLPWPMRQQPYNIGSSVPRLDATIGY